MEGRQAWNGRRGGGGEKRVDKGVEEMCTLKSRSE